MAPPETPTFSPFAALGINPNGQNAAAIAATLTRDYRRATRYRHPDKIAQLVATAPELAATAFPRWAEIEQAYEYLSASHANITTATAVWGANFEQVYHVLRVPPHPLGVITTPTMLLANTPRGTTPATAARYANFGGYPAVATPGSSKNNPYTLDSDDDAAPVASASASSSAAASASAKRKRPATPATPTPAARKNKAPAYWSTANDDFDESESDDDDEDSEEDGLPLPAKGLANVRRSGLAAAAAGGSFVPGPRAGPTRRSGSNSVRNAALPLPLFPQDRIMVGDDGRVGAGATANAVVFGVDARGRGYYRIIARDSNGNPLPATGTTARNHQDINFRAPYAGLSASATRLLAAQHLSLPANQRP
jgi:hypothetical protein